MLDIADDIANFRSLISNRRSWAFIVGALGSAAGWAAITDNLRSGPPTLIGILAVAAALCGFTALFLPERLFWLYLAIMAAGVAALVTAGLFIALG